MAALQAEGLMKMLAQRDALSCHAGWHSAKQLEDAEKRAEFAKREEQLAAEKAASKRAYERSLLLDADRRRRGIIGNGSADPNAC